MEKIFKLDPETHTYWLGDERLPSVSEIISPLSNYSGIHPERLRLAQEYGKAVHKTIELWLKNDLDEATLDPALEKPLDAFVEWYEAFSSLNGKVLAIEAPHYHGKLKYAGTPDLIFEGVLVDIKTSFPKAMELKYSIQLSAYEKLLPEFPHKELYVLYLDAFSVEHTMWNARKKQSWSMFRFLLDYYQAGEKIKLWKLM